ncbi:eukaryotic translation initiation factor 3 subunit B [Coccidioides immitis RMSCC 3703]|uniref:Eukaryotic translation initiation factor 3 subunit B n=1 Tax=Coccidioides immitis RMSCC 3703 TaxID=454286 RepID=A0A0J8R0L8_COCIT|nr:eukaryotic translation initiation factor 3 subunit B [Coccidioides immitis RMSCC 3703]
MAPSFDTLSEQDLHEEEVEIDFSDLKAQYEVRLEEGLDAFVVIDGLPVVPEESKPKLIKFLLKKLNTVGRTREDAIFMPLNEKGMSEGRPIQLDGLPGALSYEEEGKNIIIWDITTGKPLRSFVSHELAAPAGPDGDAAQAKKKVQWPAFKWSADEKFVARMLPGQSISIYELPRMNLLDRTSVKIEGVMDFEWSPATVQREGVKQSEQLLSFWTPEIGSNPAKVGLMSIPSKEVVRTRNLFNVSDVKLHWQSQGAYVCVKVDRHSKSKKSLATNLEIFRVREKVSPSKSSTRSRIPSLTSLGSLRATASFSSPLERYLLAPLFPQKLQSRFSLPRRQRVVLLHFDIDFWDLDFEGEKPENEKDLSANLQLMKTNEHFGVTDIDWDPTGRYVVSSASAWTHSLENGYHIHTFSGTTLTEHAVEKFKQLVWRPRPPTLLSKEEQKKVRRNLREYSREFDEEDKYAVDIANTAIVEMRKRLLNEWTAWLKKEKEMVEEEREVLGLPKYEEEPAAKPTPGAEDDTIVEEIVEEIIEESEEIVA